jgi:invasion protein IalB
MRLIRTALIPVAAILLSWSAAAQQSGGEVTQYKDWTLACEGAKQSSCMIRQVLLNPQTQAPIMTVMIGHSVNIRTNPVIVFNLPATTDNKELLTLKVDENDQLGIPDIRCNKRICSAIANFTPDIAGQFQKGGTVSVTFPQQSQRVGLKVSLSGFSSAYRALLARHGSG